MIRTVAWIFFLITSSALAGCAGGPDISNTGLGVTNAGLIISNLKTGLLKRSGVDFDVYEQGSHFAYKPNGTCTANGVQMPCMWWGFTFDYRAPEEGAELLCSVRFSRPQNMVSPRSEYGVRTGGEYRIRLSGEGTHRNVGYQNTRNELPGMLSNRTVCTYQDETVLDFELAVTFGESDVAARTQASLETREASR
jgi:hypothetical protein